MSAFDSNGMIVFSEHDVVCVVCALMHKKKIPINVDMAVNY